METISYKVGSTWTEVSLGSLGVGPTFKVEFGTHGESKCTLPLGALPPETSSAIPFESQCIIYIGRTGIGAGGTILFQGRRTDNSGQASGSGANQQLVIEDAWYDLRFLTFQGTWQQITSYSGTTPTYGTPWTWPDCVLFQSWAAGQLQPDGTFGTYAPAPVNGHITTGQAIKEMLAYAIYFGGVNLQIGTIDPAAYVPFYPVRSMRVADAVNIALRTHPDCICEIDYTTTPPTFNIRQRSNLTAVTLPYKGISGAKTHLTSSVRPRPDLQPSRVGIYIKSTTQVNGNDVVQVGTDIYPVGQPSGLRSLDVSVDMTGPKLATTAAQLTTAAFDPTSLAWWAQKVQTLKPQPLGQIPASGTGALALLDSTVNGGVSTHPKGIQVCDDSGNPITLGSYGYELLDGNPCSWMQLSGGGAVNVIEANVVGFFSYYKETTAGSANIVDQIGEHMHTCRVKLINTASATFKASQILNTGEVYPAGLAQSIYSALSTLQYNFVHTILEAPFGTIIKPGKHCLNLSGGALAWATMNAMVQGVDIEVMFNPASNQTVARTTVRCGPVQHLEAGELVQLFNLFTNRDLSKINPSERSGGTSMSGGSVGLGNNGPKENAVPAPSVPQVTNHVSVNPSTNTVTGQVVNSAPAIAAILAATTPTPFTGFSATDILTMQPREIKVCDDSGNIYYIIVQSTGGYTKPS